MSMSCIIKFKSLEICMIGSVSFVWVVKKKHHEIFVIFMRNIEKALNLKQPTNLIFMLSKKYHEFLDVFSRQLANSLSFHKLYDHHICLKLSSQSIFEFLYDMFRDELLILKKYLNNNLFKEFIQTSSFSAVSSILFVHKSEDGLQFCVDYRDLNIIIIKNCYLLSLIHKTLYWMSHTQYFIKLNVIVIFNKLWMTKSDEWLTVFCTHYDLYKYLIMLFELFNASASFQNYINDILQEHLNVFCTAYINDILMYSDILKNHKKHVWQVLQKLHDAGLQLNIDKCEFHVQKVKYLELIISVNEIKMNSAKVETVQKWPISANEWDVRDFLDFMNFYWHFIWDFFRLVWPLMQLIKKNVQYQWKSNCETAFQKLKMMFTQTFILQHFDWTHEVIVKTDTSDTVIADVLLQNDNQRWLWSVIYFFSKMSLTEINYNIYDKKLLAIIQAFEKWCSELKSSEMSVQILCDHKNLKWFMFIKSLSQCQTWWSEFLFWFNFKIIYRLGCFNTWADALTCWSEDLSRKEKDDSQRSQQEQILLKPANLNEHLTVVQAQLSRTCKFRLVSSHDFHHLICLNANSMSSDQESEAETENFKDEETSLKTVILKIYQQDKFVKNIISKLQERARMQKEFLLTECREVNNQFWFWNHLYLSETEDIHNHVICEAHNLSAAGHSKQHKTYDLVAHYYWWSEMMSLVWRFIHNCHTCRQSRYFKNKYYGQLKSLSVLKWHWIHISLNFIVNLPSSEAADDHIYQNILIVMNHLTKMWHFIPCQFMIKKEIACLFHQHVWKHHRLSSFIILNWNTQFVTHFWNELCQCLDIRFTLFMVYHSETDEQTENTNAVLKQYLQVYVTYLQDDWANWLLSAEFVTNNHVSETTQFSSFFTNYEQHPHMKLESRET